MVRNLIAFAGVAMIAGTASAAFLGVEIREDKDPGVQPANTRTFNIYAVFDSNDFPDAVLSVGQPDATTGWGINTDENPGATFFQVGAPFGGDTAPDSGFFGFEPTLEADTFVTIGIKDSAGGDSTALDPDFSFGADFVTGGWFNSSPPNRNGEGTLNPDTGNYDTLLAQVTISGLADGASIISEGPESTVLSTFLTGQMTVNTQGAQGGADAQQITFDIPTPGAVALFGVAGLAGVRRRR